MLLAVFLLSSAIGFAGVLACGIGLVFTIPLQWLMLVVAYLALTGQPVANPLARDEPFAELEPL
jgi:hypothetical protein